MEVARHEISLVPIGMSVSCRDEIRKRINEGLAIGNTELAPYPHPTTAGVVLNQAQRPWIDNNRKVNMAFRQKVRERLHVFQGAPNSAFDAQWVISVPNVIAWNRPADARRWRSADLALIRRSTPEA